MSLSVGKDTSRANCKADDYVPRIYSGIFNDLRLMKEPAQRELLFIATDFPFSLIADTVALPYTIPAQVIWGDICSPPSDQAK